MGPEERISAVAADKNMNLDECAPLAVSLGGLSLKTITEPDEPDNEKNSEGEESHSENAVRTLWIVKIIIELNLGERYSLFVYK